MPRNGDGSSDNGPIEGHEIVHGTDGDETLQHTKKVAPMPEQEQGDALPGLGAGGVAAPIADNAEEYGTNEPRKDPLAEGDDTNDGAEATASGGAATRPSNKRQKTGDVDVSQGKDTSSSTSHSNTNSNSHSSGGNASGGSGSGAKSSGGAGGAGGAEHHDLDHVMRDKAEKYVNLNEDEVNMAASTTEEGKREARTERRNDAVGDNKHAGKGHGGADAEKYGGHADVEALHGEAGGKGGKSGSGSKSEGGHGSGSGHGHGQEHDGGHVNELEQVQRHQAEKFGVNLGD